MNFIVFLWSICTVVQTYLGFGTAYRLTKAGGDNGVSLFGWMIVTNLVAMVPGLGIWMWFKYRDGTNHSDKLPRTIMQDEPNSNGGIPKDFI